MLIGRMVPNRVGRNVTIVRKVIATVILDRIRKPLTKSISPFDDGFVLRRSDGVRQIVGRPARTDDQHSFVAQWLQYFAKAEMVRGATAGIDR